MAKAVVLPIPIQYNTTTKVHQIIYNNYSYYLHYLSSAILIIIFYFIIGVVNGGLDGTQAIGPDYDEIKEDDHIINQCTHQESSGKILPSEKSMGKSHDYHTLMPGGEQESTFKSKVAL